MKSQTLCYSKTFNVHATYRDDYQNSSKAVQERMQSLYTVVP